MSAKIESPLRNHLNYQPQELKFGTSGRRGDVIHLTQLEIYINATAELEYLQSLTRQQGGIARGEEFYFAYDLRPSSTRLVPEQQGRGEIAQAIECAARDAGMRPANLGPVPTPALANFALERGRGSMMITGSHIPFERNGFKTNTAVGELLKKDEEPIRICVQRVRERLYRQPFSKSLFDAHGMFRGGHRELPPEISEGREHYLRRYTGFYDADALRGKRLLVYEHSAVGRDILAEILQQLGAEVIRAGRSNTFVPIDTENIDEEQLGVIQTLATDAWQNYGPIDAVVSTDGDSDRPLLLSVQSADPCHVRFHGGDLVGMVVAQHLGANAIVVPITCNDAIDRGPLKDVLEPKTRIGSPFVIAGMEKARHKGRVAVCGWEANGGFLIGSDFVRRGKKLKALPTRDAVLPILGVLSESCGQNAAVSDLFDRLPRRFSRAALLKNFPRPASERILARFSPGNPAIKDVVFDQPDVVACDENGQEITFPEAFSAFMQSIRRLAMQFFTEDLGFARILRINYIDGVRFYFSNGDVAHIRPSGNADELRIYAVADSQARADTIVRCAVAEPAGILRRL